MKKILLYSLVVVSVFSCYKLEENDKRYTGRKLQKVLEGTWEIQDYQIDGTSYLDTFFKVNPKGNCLTYTFVQWKNSASNKGDKDFDTGQFWGDCQTATSPGYDFDPRFKKLQIGGSYILDSIYFFKSSPSFDVLKLEKNELILENEENSYSRRISFKKA